MATVEVNQEKLAVRFTRGERLMALRRHDLELPVANIQSVRKVASAWNESGFRKPFYRKRGSFTPNLIIGSWHRRGGPSTFAVVRPNQPGYVITTTGEPFDLIVLSTPDVPALDARVVDP